MNIPFFQLSLGGDELERIKKVIESGWLTSGKQVLEFEKQFAGTVGAKHAVAVNSCTAALHLALEALGIGPGDKVIVPTLTFTATAEIVRYLGADPIIVDVDANTGLITTESIKKSIFLYKNIKACIPVHFGGQPAQLEGEDGIIELCNNEGVPVVDDAAHALPASIGNCSIGNLCRATCFSFYANKTMTTGEGGMLTTNDDVLAQRARTMRLHGIDRDAWDRFGEKSNQWEYDIVAPGYKYNMTDIAAAIGLSQLEKVESWRNKRSIIAKKYTAAFKDFEFLQLPTCLPNRVNSHHLYWIVLNQSSPIGRNELISLLEENNIGASVHYKPLHQMTYWKTKYKLCSSDYPGGEHIWSGCLSLPIFPGMSEKQQERVIEVVTNALTKIQ